MAAEAAGVVAGRRVRLVARAGPRAVDEPGGRVLRPAPPQGTPVHAGPGPRRGTVTRPAAGAPEGVVTEPSHTAHQRTPTVTVRAKGWLTVPRALSATGC